MSMTKIKHTLSAYSPEICVGLGLVCWVASAIFSAKAAPKARKAKEETDEIKEIMDEALETGETASDDLDENGNSIMVPYTEEDYKSDMKLLVGKKIVCQTKPYLPAIGFGIAGTVGILTGFGILKKRHAATLSLLATTTTLFQDYRTRVINDLGKEKDHQYLTGISTTKEKVVVTDAKGKDKKVEVEKINQLDSSVGDIPWLSPYAIKITKDNCSQFESFKGDPIYVAHWLEVTQEMCNTHLHTDGVLYLDWILEQLGVRLDETNPSLNSYIAHNVGWIDTDFYYDAARKQTFTNEGDRYVDFGCWDDEGKLTLTVGKDGAVYLDFNVDGWINGRIPKKHAGYIQQQVEKYPEIEK